MFEQGPAGYTHWVVCSLSGKRRVWGSLMGAGRREGAVAGGQEDGRVPGGKPDWK